jgi:hypothetical protein
MSTPDKVVLPSGWSKVTVPIGGMVLAGAMSDYAAVMPLTDGTWCICPVLAGIVLTGRKGDYPPFSNLTAAIVAAEMFWPRR